MTYPTPIRRTTPTLNPILEGSDLHRGADLLFGEAADGRLIPIADVPSGLACEMVCPECRTRLVAKKGSVVRHHFAHESGLACVGAYETLLHKMAKQVIADALGIKLPTLEAEVGSQRRYIAPASWFAFDHVALEVWQDGFRPDIIGYRRDRSLAVEVMVTHGCEPEKIALIEERQIATIEIDLSKVPRDVDYETFKRLVLGTAPRRWIFNAKLAAVLGELRFAEARAETAAAAEKRRLAVEAAARRAEAEAKRLAEQKAYQERLSAQAAEREEQRRAYVAKAAAREAHRRELEKPEVERIKRELLEYATRMMGREKAEAWMQTGRLRTGQPPASQMESLDHVEDYWADIRRRLMEQDRIDAVHAEAVKRLTRAVRRFFPSDERAELWLKSRHPKLGLKAPREICLEPGGFDRCLAVLK